MNDPILAKLLALGVADAAPLPYAACKSYNLRLAEQLPSTPEQVYVLVAPYHVHGEPTILSSYAWGRDYHLYFSELYTKITEEMREADPMHWYRGFADHSLIAEVDAAVQAGLGVRGDNGLLIHPRYGSYLFLGTLLTDRPYAGVFSPKTGECLHCGACRRACPSKERCLSEITQTKGTLSKEDIALMRQEHTAWGCDACQRACPLNRDVEETPIPFFRESLLPTVTAAEVEAMPKEQFQQRAFAWRGRACILRNLQLLEAPPEA